MNKDIHCCEFMKIFIDDESIRIKYNSKFRSYSIYLRGSSSIQIIKYCPWCGAKLPKRLKKEWANILKKEFKIDDPYSFDQQDKIPEEFKSDKWWKKRPFLDKKKQSNQNEPEESDDDCGVSGRELGL